MIETNWFEGDINKRSFDVEAFNGVVVPNELARIFLFYINYEASFLRALSTFVLIFYYKLLVQLLPDEYFGDFKFVIPFLNYVFEALPPVLIKSFTL